MKMIFLGLLTFGPNLYAQHAVTCSDLETRIHRKIEPRFAESINELKAEMGPLLNAVTRERVQFFFELKKQSLALGNPVDPQKISGESFALVDDKTQSLRQRTCEQINSLLIKSGSTYSNNCDGPQIESVGGVAELRFFALNPTDVSAENTKVLEIGNDRFISAKNAKVADVGPHGVTVKSITMGAMANVLALNEDLEGLYKEFNGDLASRFPYRFSNMVYHQSWDGKVVLYSDLEVCDTTFCEKVAPIIYRSGYNFRPLVRQYFLPSRCFSKL